MPVTEPRWVETMPRPVRRMVEPPSQYSPLTGAGLRAIRESLGMSAKDLANALGASLRMVQMWEGQEQVPAWAVGEVQFLIQVTEQWTKELASAAGAVSIRRDGWRIVEDDRIMPEGWWRATVGRVLGEGSALQVRWNMPEK